MSQADDIIQGDRRLGLASTNRRLDPPGARPLKLHEAIHRLGAAVRRAFAEFLKLPGAIVAGFLLLAAATTYFDYGHAGWLQPLREPIRTIFFQDSKATGDLLATIAGSIITITSITFSLLLLAVQQAAAALTHQVYDQFLRRKVNQVYFGFFVGLAVYALTILATADPPYNPVFGAALAMVLTVVALMLIIVLLYTTINQMRPTVVIETIHDLTLAARERQLGWLRQTRRSPQMKRTVSVPVRAAVHGYVVRVDLGALGAAVEKAQGKVEIVLKVSIGAYVAYQDPLAEVRGASSNAAAEVAEAVLPAIHIEQQRDLDTDPSFGVEQLAIIGWTSVSTAKSNPSPGLLVIRNLRDLLARWTAEEEQEKSSGAAPQTIPVVYTDDLFTHLMDAFETLAVVASESMQPQTAAEVIRTIAVVFDRLPADVRKRAEDMIRRMLSALGEHVLTAELNEALSGLIQTLDAAGRGETAALVRAAQERLGASVGKLGSRATRVSEGC